MKEADIIKGRSYVSKSGRAERHVLDIGLHIEPHWLGHPAARPKNEPGVRYLDTRLGMTFYGRRSGKKPIERFLSTFASWAAAEVPEADAAPHN